MVLALFVYPLGMSLVSAFTTKDGQPSFDNFVKAFELYGSDIVFTFVIVSVSTVLIGLLAAAIGGYLVLGAHPVAVSVLKGLYRWPLFIPFIVAAQCMRTFLAKNGIMNNTLDTLGLVDVGDLSGLLDWRGIIVTFVWKETPFVALAGFGRHGGTRPRDHRSGRQPWREWVAHPRRDHPAAGRRRDVGRADIGVCHDAVGLVGADHDQRRIADDDHGRYGVPRQFL